MQAALTTPLTDLASKINQEHRACSEAVNKGLEHALSCGRLLTEAKQQVGHGEWQRWIDDNCEFGDRTARTYMQVVKRWPEIKAKRQTSADLSIDGAVKLLAEPRPANKPAERPCWSTKATNERIIKKLDIQRCFGWLLAWATDNGVAATHELAGWLCPDKGWMDEERAVSLLTTLSMRDAFTREKEARKSAEDVVLEMCEYYNSITPEDSFPTICMCDVVMAMHKFSKDRLPEEEPRRFAPCEKYGPKCVFGLCVQRDPEWERRMTDELDAYFKRGGPKPSWLDEIDALVKTANGETVEVCELVN